jgi:hypothetical protein
MRRLSRTDKAWLILFVVILIALVAGCMLETVLNSKPWHPRPAPPVQREY